MKIGIIGYGFVGNALHKGLKSSNEVCLIDPKLKTSEDDLDSFDPDIIFICVPTPMDDNGGQDLRILNNVIENLLKKDLNTTIVIKSTILPNVLEAIRVKLPNIIYNPEFLREAYADEDFINSNLIVIGGSNSSEVNKIEEFYSNNTNCICKNYISTDLITASFIKFTINSFLATKVSFFNQINQLFKLSNPNDSWDNLIKYISHDKRIGESHMSVPGNDGKFGFGGACLPKDSKAFLDFSKEQGAQLSILKEVITVNNIIRGGYTYGQREIDQNINFLTEDN
jgi:UDPglucose 6-dehydrogenase